MKYYFQKMDKEFMETHLSVSKCAFCGKEIKYGEEFVAWIHFDNDTHSVRHIIHRKHIKESELENLYSKQVAKII